MKNNGRKMTGIYDSDNKLIGEGDLLDTFIYKEDDDIDVRKFRVFNHGEIGDNHFTLHEPLTGKTYDLDILDRFDSVFVSNTDSLDTKTMQDEYITIIEDNFSLVIDKKGKALKYIHEPSPEICRAFIKQTGLALKYVKDQTEELCLEAINQNVAALAYVKQPTVNIYLAAVKKNGMMLKYIQEQNLEICLAAIRQNRDAIQYVLDKDALLKQIIDENYANTTIEYDNDKVKLPISRNRKRRHNRH